MALLEVRDVTIHFGGIVALDGVPFAVEEGHISGLIGPNGAGKTAAYNVITRLYEPDTWSSMGRRSSGRLRRRHRRFRSRERRSDHRGDPALEDGVQLP